MTNLINDTITASSQNEDALDNTRINWLQPSQYIHQTDVLNSEQISSIESIIPNTQYVDQSDPLGFLYGNHTPIATQNPDTLNANNSSAVSTLPSSLTAYVDLPNSLEEDTEAQISPMKNTLSGVYKPSFNQIEEEACSPYSNNHDTAPIDSVAQYYQDALQHERSQHPSIHNQYDIQQGLLHPAQEKNPFFKKTMSLKEKLQLFKQLLKA